MSDDKQDDQDILICRCEEVSRGEIRSAIADGAEDLRGVRIRTRVGMGLCQGKQCERLVRGIIAQELKKDPATIAPYQVRPPVRALSLADMTREDNG